MALTYSDLLDILITRATSLNLVRGAEQKVDVAELEIYMFQALLTLVETIDLPAFERRDDAMAVTTLGKQDYPVPRDFGRLILPRVQNRRGMAVYDGFTRRELTYLDPPVFVRRMALTNATPLYFTVMERTLWLYPAPDANGTSDYIVRGVYIRSVERPDLDDEVPLSYPTALIDETLYRLASDVGKSAQVLHDARTESITRLAAGSR